MISMRSEGGHPPGIPGSVSGTSGWGVSSKSCGMNQVRNGLLPKNVGRGGVRPPKDRPQGHEEMHEFARR
jgi:hypothetical protein